MEPGVEPNGETMKNWFVPNEAFDAELRYLRATIQHMKANFLRQKYGSAVEEASRSSTEDLLQFVKNEEDALAVLLLVDQVPRNIYRGREAQKVAQL